MAKFGVDPQMAGMLASYDIALLETAPQSLFSISPHSLYVIERGGEAVMRYIRWGGRHYYLVTEAELDQPTEWETLLLSPLQFRAAVKARVIWLGREQDRDAASQRGRFL